MGKMDGGRLGDDVGLTSLGEEFDRKKFWDEADLMRRRIDELCCRRENVKKKN